MYCAYTHTHTHTHTHTIASVYTQTCIMITQPSAFMALSLNYGSCMLTSCATLMKWTGYETMYASIDMLWHCKSLTTTEANV